MPTDPRRLAGSDLAAALRDSRTRTLALVADLSDEQWQVPQRFGVNPIAWELAHIAWFAEFWTLRGPHRVDDRGLVGATLPPRHAGPDALFDSARLAHADRWGAPLPDRRGVRRMLDAQLDACLAALPASDDDEALYFFRLALFHEDMHGEAFAWLRAALAYPAPDGAVLPRLEPAAAVRVPAGEVTLGAAGAGFAFDNERPACTVSVDAFEIDATPVSAGAFAAFVDAGGYADAAYWPDAAGDWLRASGAQHPAHWRRGPEGWQQRWFDRWLALHPQTPVVHVNAWEAEAYCRWAGRRLPSAPEWVHATPHLRCWGDSVWEWTADAFEPYPGFEPGPYRDYSAPWFGNHRELRGGAMVTHPRMRHAAYRNFFLPERNDVFAGFRTCSGVR